MQGDIAVHSNLHRYLNVLTFANDIDVVDEVKRYGFAMCTGCLCSR